VKKILYLSVAYISISNFFAQQDPQYNLYQFNQMIINPAYAGARESIAIIMDYRKQWVNFPGSPTTFGLSIHSPILNNKVGIGLNVISDKIGAKSVSGAYGSFAYIAKLNNRLKLSFGLRAGYLNYNISNVNYKDVNETVISDNTKTNGGSLDIDAGLFLKGNSFFSGFSVNHLNNPQMFSANYTITPTGTTNPIDYNVNYQLNPHFFFIIGKLFAVNENFIVSPSFIIKSVYTKQVVDVNLNFFLKKRLWLGVFVRQEFGLGFLTQFYVNDKLRIGYSYDGGFGSRKALGTSHEIMLGFDLKKRQLKSVTPRFL